MTREADELHVTESGLLRQWNAYEEDRRVARVDQEQAEASLAMAKNSRRGLQYILHGLAADRKAAEAIVKKAKIDYADAMAAYDETPYNLEEDKNAQRRSKGVITL